MKILFTLFEINDWGGICADLIFKYKGLTEAGHDVDFVLLKDTDRKPYIRRNSTRESTYPGPVEGMMVNPRAGFFGIPVVSYGSDNRMEKWYKRAAKYDLIIHEIPGPNPTKASSLDKNDYWRKLYQHDTPQIISAHDANFRDQYPHLIYIADKIKGISCTNQAGYAALSWFPAPRAFVGAPHPVLDWTKQKRWNDRKPQAISAHMWKAWKHMEMTVMAAPYLKKTQLITAGEGLEQAYMTSKDKMKPKYIGIWDKAIEAGMDYRGPITLEEVQKLYRSSRVMVDTSWAKKFMGLGCHFNRSIIEGFNNGCVPICVSENMIETGFQLKMFKAGKTHFEIGANSSPKELAQLIDHVSHLKEDEAMEMIENGRQVLLRFFDYRKSSLDYIKLAKGKPAGVYPKLDVGSLNSTIKSNAEEFLKGVATNKVRKGYVRALTASDVKRIAESKKSLF